MINIDRARLVPGWMSDAELQWLAERAAIRSTIIEIGSWKGRSTRALADNIATHLDGGPDAHDARVFAVDHWQGQLFAPDAGPSVEVRERGSDAVFNEFIDFTHDLINEGRLRVLKGPSNHGAKTLKAYGVRADMVFIDGDHQYAGCKADILAYRELLKPGGLLCGHDYNGLEIHKGVKQSVDELFPGAEKFCTIWWIKL